MCRCLYLVVKKLKKRMANNMIHVVHNAKIHKYVTIIFMLLKLLKLKKEIPLYVQVRWKNNGKQQLNTGRSSFAGFPSNKTLAQDTSPKNRGLSLLGTITKTRLGQLQYVKIAKICNLHLKTGDIHTQKRVWENKDTKNPPNCTFSFNKT